MNYPFLSRNNLPIQPGANVTYYSKRYGNVFAEVTECRMFNRMQHLTDEHGRWVRDEKGRIKYKKELRTRINVRVTASAETPARSVGCYGHGYQTAVSPGVLEVII